MNSISPGLLTSGVRRSAASGAADTPAQGLPPKADLEIQLTVADSFESAGLDVTEWDRAVERLGGPVYMTWDWLRMWWEFYGQGGALRLMIFRKDGEIVGLLPLYLQAAGLPCFHLVVARLVGANIPPKVFDPPIEPASMSTCICLALEALKAQDCGLLSLGPVSDEFIVTHGAAEEPWHLPLDWQMEKVPAGVYTYFPLPETHEAYLSSLGKNEQKNRRKYELRLLRKEAEVTVEVLGRAAEPLEQPFTEFVRLHTAQWRAEGMPGHFGAWPRALDYNWALVQVQARHRRVRLLRIRANGQTVCAQYAFAWADRWFWELPAREVGPAWDRFSLGPRGIVVMIEQAIREGMKRIEGGLGHYPYKLRLGAAERPVWIYRFTRRSSGRRIRLWTARAVRWGLQWGYHKLYYRRIQPRLPEAWRRPQWRLWLRHDF